MSYNEKQAAKRDTRIQRKAEREARTRKAAGRRRLIKFGAFGFGTLLLSASGAGLIIQASRHTTPPPPEGTFSEKISILDKEVGFDKRKLDSRMPDIKNLAAELFAAEMAESYGLNFNPTALADQVKVSKDSEFRRAVTEESGCTTMRNNIRTTDAGLTNPSWKSAFINSEAIHRDTKGVLRPVKEIVSAVIHEVGHHVPEDDLNPARAAIFQSVITQPGWNVIGVKGFALIVEAPEHNKSPEKKCVGRPGYELSIIEESLVETDKNSALKRAGIILEGPAAYKFSTKKFNDLFLAKLTQDDRKKVGIQHKSSDLEALLGFYKQNFGFRGSLAEAYIEMNRVLS